MAQTPETPNPLERLSAGWRRDAERGQLKIAGREIVRDVRAAQLLECADELDRAKALTDQRHAEQIAALTATVERLRQENKIAEVAFQAAIAAELLASKLYEDAKGELTQLRQQLAEREQEIAAASTALDELVAPDASKSLAQRIRDEFAHFQMVIEHCETVYDHFTRGRISKPNTLPSEVISVASDLLEEDITEAVQEETEELRQQRGTLKAALEGLRPFVCVQPIPCSGWKCRESWCPSCCGDEEAEVAVQRAQDALKLADAALATCAPETGENR